jgi:hypothetical protein
LNRIHDSSRLKKRFSTALAELFFAPTVFLGLRFLVVIEQGKDYSNPVNPNREQAENIVYPRDSCCFSFPRIFHRSNFPCIGRFASHLSNRYSYLAGFIRLQGGSMQLRKLGSIVLASSLAISMSASYSLAQDVAHDVDHAAKDTAHGTKVAAKDTVHGTKVAAKDTAHGTKVAAKDTAHGTKVAAKDTAHGTKVAAKDTAHGTEKAGDKIAGKPTPQ